MTFTDQDSIRFNKDQANLWQNGRENFNLGTFQFQSHSVFIHGRPWLEAVWSRLDKRSVLADIARILLEILEQVLQVKAVQVQFLFLRAFLSFLGAS